MKFVQRDLGESSDVSSGGDRRDTLKEALILVVYATVSLVLLVIAVGMVVDFATKRIPIDREMEWFSPLHAIMAHGPIPVELEPKWRQAHELMGRLQALPLVPPVAFQLAYSPIEEPNAFAIPGGQIVLTKGLLEALDQDVSIAFVLAHEIGHFVNRDHLQQMGRAIGLQASLSILMGGEVNSIAQMGINGWMLNYSRRQEQQADDFALQCIDQLFEERSGAEKLFLLLKEHQDSLPDWAYMFSTHPDNQSRIRVILGSPSAHRND